MADKKVERSPRERPLTPSDKLITALSESGTFNMADRSHDRGKAALVDKFREREERWRQEQAMQDRAKAQERLLLQVEQPDEEGEQPAGGES